jgi:YaaC-like protein
LSAYYGETETFRVYNLKELLANMSFIHRTYSLTFVSQSEIFFSLVNFKYVFDTDTNSVYFYAKPEKQESKTKARNRLPSSLEVVETDTGFYIRSTASIPWRRPTKATQAEMTALLGLHRELRFDLQYINGTYTLWYAKMNFTRGHSTRRVQRALPTLILAAAHRLSEICRCRPDQLSAFLEGSQNWLLSEFVAMSSDQFIDEIASEITGNQFFVPNVRAPAEPDGE